MDFQSLKLFLDLAQSRSFVRTAEQNHLSPSTLSRHIQRLEDEMGQMLFLRDNRQVQLTAAGERFLVFAQRSWADWQQIRQQFLPSTQEIIGELKLFCSVTAAYSHLPQILSRFRQRYPRVEIKLTTGDPAKSVNVVQSLQADLALTGKPDILPNHIAFHYIDDITLSLIVPRIACRATELLQQPEIDWQEMPFILPVDGPARQRIEQWFKQQKINTPQIYATVAGHEAIMPMVALGCGVALLPDVVIKHSPMNNQISRFVLPSPILPFELGLCVQQWRLQEPIIKAFWALATEKHTF